MQQQSRLRLVCRFTGRCYRAGCVGNLQTRLGIGYALGVHGMRAQIRKSAVVVQPRSLLQSFKHRRGTAQLKTCIGQNAKAHAVGFALHVAREIELVLGNNRLPTDDGRSSRIRAFGRCQRAQHHRGNQPRRLLALLGDQARDVALRDMAQLMTHHRRQLVGTAHR